MAVAAGCRALGENKVQEARQKSDELSDLDVTWSVIGHLQANKAKTVAGFAHEFQALDSLRVADALERHLEAAGRLLDVFVQVNTSGEDSKYGIAPDELPALLRELAHRPSLRVRGLMTLAAFTSDVDTVRSCFRLLRTLRDEVREQDPDLIGPGELSWGCPATTRSLSRKVLPACASDKPSSASDHCPTATTGPTPRRPNRPRTRPFDPSRQPAREVVGDRGVLWPLLRLRRRRAGLALCTRCHADGGWLQDRIRRPSIGCPRRVGSARRAARPVRGGGRCSPGGLSGTLCNRRDLMVRS